MQCRILQKDGGWMTPDQTKKIFNGLLDKNIKKKATKILTFTVIMNKGGIRDLKYDTSESLRDRDEKDLSI
jgi:hypothetical protein